MNCIISGSYINLCHKAPYGRNYIAIQSYIKFIEVFCGNSHMAFITDIGEIYISDNPYSSRIVPHREIKLSKIVTYIGFITEFISDIRDNLKDTTLEI